MPELQKIVTQLEIDPALLDGFHMRHWSHLKPMKKAIPLVVIPDAEEEAPEEADKISSDTAALSAFSKHFNFENVVLSTLLDSNGGFYVKAKEIVLALGYKAGASAVTLHVDPERHCSLRELLSKSDITLLEIPKLETYTKAELDSHWLSEAGMYQLI